MCVRERERERENEKERERESICILYTSLYTRIYKVKYEKNRL